MTLRLWDVDSGVTRRVFRGHTGVVVGCVFSPDGESVLSASNDKTLRLWDIKSGETRRIFEGHRHGVTSCAFSSDGTKVRSTTECIGGFRLWDAASGAVLRDMPGRYYHVCEFAPDGASIMCTDIYGEMIMYDTTTGEKLHTFGGHRMSVHVCTFTSDSAYVVTASFDMRLTIWDAARGEPLCTLRGDDTHLDICTFSPDETHLIGCTEWFGDTLKIWEWDVSSHVLPLQWFPAAHARFPPRFRAATAAVLALAHKRFDAARHTDTPCYPTTPLARLPLELLLWLVGASAHAL